MAHMLTADELKTYKKRYPDAAVVLYVNTLAERRLKLIYFAHLRMLLTIVESLEMIEFFLVLT